MTLKVLFSRNAEKFLEANSIRREEIFELVKEAVKKFQGEDVNLV